MTHPAHGGIFCTMFIEAYQDRDLLADHCGIVAAWGMSDFSFFNTGLEGLHIMQTRGYDGAGFVSFNEKGDVTVYKGEGRISDVFPDSVVQMHDPTHARLWMYQVRYGTNGSFNRENVQPVLKADALSGELFVVAHNGQFAFEHDTDESDTVRFTEALVQANHPSWDQRIVSTLSTLEGAWSLAIGTKEALYLARDPRGIRPLSYGWGWDNQSQQTICVAASETKALQKIGIRFYGEVLPGQVIRFGTEGMRVLQERTQVLTPALCIFENVYIMDGRSRVHRLRETTDSIQNDRTVDDVRRQCGIILARESPLTKDDVDLVIGIPGTGIQGGIAYAQALGLPYVQAIHDSEKQNRRTFMHADVSQIFSEVLTNFILDIDLLRDKRVCLVDDSLVRGNVMTGLISLLQKECGVHAAHVRILCPPIDKPCHLGINTRKADELIVSRMDGDLSRVQQTIGADSLVYLSPEGLREAMTGSPNAKGFCLGCMVGHEPPIDRVGNVLWKSPN